MMTAALIASLLALVVSVINLSLYFQAQDRQAPRTRWPDEEIED